MSLTAHSSFKQRRGWVLLVVCAVALAVAALRSRGDGTELLYKTAPVERGDFSLTITATGTVEPEEAVDVGAQVAGRIIEFGTDKNGKIIDYGSEVEEGMVLARIDEALYLSDVAQAQAELARAKADLQQFRAKLVQAQRDWERAQRLGPGEALSQSAYDSYQAGIESAQASVEVGKAQVARAEAALDRAQRNLGYCIIRSPVSGVIIDRKVNIGQTVVSSLNAPSLFLIAKDLKRMQVWVSVNEADIGKVFPGQAVRFTVDAFPGEEFKGEVGKIRLNATMTQNVVTYIVEVTTDNSAGRLLPYLTANATFEVEHRENVLQVPSIALRWSPPGEERDVPGIWVLEGDALRRAAVAIGSSDGRMTVIESGEIEDGDAVVIGELEPGTQDIATKNPFAPTFPRRRRK